MAAIMEKLSTNAAITLMYHAILIAHMIIVVELLFKNITITIITITSTIITRLSRNQPVPPLKLLKSTCQRKRRSETSLSSNLKALQPKLLRRFFQRESNTSILLNISHNLLQLRLSRRFSPRELSIETLSIIFLRAHLPKLLRLSSQESIKRSSEKLSNQLVLLLVTRLV